MKDQLLLHLKDAEKANNTKTPDQYLLICEDLLAIFRELQSTLEISASDLRARLLGEPINSINQLIRIVTNKDDDALRGKLRPYGINSNMIQEIDRIFILAGKRKIPPNSPAEIMGSAVTELENLIKSKGKKISQSDLDEISNAIFKVLKTISENTQIALAKGFEVKSSAQIKEVLLAGYEFEKSGEFIKKVVDPIVEKNSLKEISNTINRSGFNVELVQKIRGIFRPFGSKITILKPTEIINNAAQDLIKSIVKAKKLGTPSSKNMTDFNAALQKVVNNFSIFINELCTHSTMSGLEHIKSKSAADIEGAFLKNQIAGPNDLFRILTNNSQISGDYLTNIASATGHFGINKNVVQNMGKIFSLSNLYTADPKPQNQIKIAAEAFKQTFRENEKDRSDESQIKIVTSLKKLLDAFCNHSNVTGMREMEFLSAEEIRSGFIDKQINTFTDFSGIILGEIIPNARDPKAEIVRSAFRSQAVEIELGFIQSLGKYFEPLRREKSEDQTTSKKRSRHEPKVNQGADEMTDLLLDPNDEIDDINFGEVFDDKPPPITTASSHSKLYRQDSNQLRND